MILMEADAYGLASPRLINQTGRERERERLYISDWRLLDTRMDRKIRSADWDRGCFIVTSGLSGHGT